MKSLSKVHYCLESFGCYISGSFLWNFVLHRWHISVYSLLIFQQGKMQPDFLHWGAVAALSQIYRCWLGRRATAQYSFQFQAALYLLHIFASLGCCLLPWLQFLDPLFWWDMWGNRNYLPMLSSVFLSLPHTVLLCDNCPSFLSSCFLRVSDPNSSGKLMGGGEDRWAHGHLRRPDLSFSDGVPFSIFLLLQTLDFKMEARKRVEGFLSLLWSSPFFPQLPPSDSAVGNILAHLALGWSIVANLSFWESCRFLCLCLGDVAKV